MSCMFSSCPAIFLSICSSFSRISLCVNSISRILVNTLITWIFTAMARSLFKTQDNIVTPCSVKQKGAYRKPCLSSLEVAFCVLQSSNSFLFISNKKSGGKRFIFRLTASFSLLVSTPTVLPDHGRSSPSAPEPDKFY
jgi:hypothetical protein